MIAGPASVHICDSCVSVCKTIIDRELSETPVDEATADTNKDVKASNTPGKQFNLLEEENKQSTEYYNNYYEIEEGEDD